MIRSRVSAVAAVFMTVGCVTVAVSPNSPVIVQRSLLEEQAGDRIAPLIAVDGNLVGPVTTSELDALDIEYIEVVKGEAAIAAYGPEAVGGVILITTRQAGTTR